MHDVSRNIKRVFGIDGGVVNSIGKDDSSGKKLLNHWESIDRVAELVMGVDPSILHKVFRYAYSTHVEFFVA